MSVEIFFSVFLVILFLLLLKSSDSSSNIPPGPVKIPILGNIIQLGLADNIPYVAMHKLSQKYGPVMSLQIGFTKFVIVSSYKDMKDFLGRPEVLGRDVSGILEARSEGKNLGIVTSVGETWRKLRGYTISTLKDYGFGKNMDNVIAEELREFTNHLKSLMGANNGIVDFQTLFSLSVLNVLWNIIGGEKLPYTDAKLNYVLQLGEKMKKASLLGAALVQSFPFLRYIAPDATGYKSNVEIGNELQKFFNELLVEQKKKYIVTNGNVANCYLDSFIQKIEENSNDTNTVFTDEQFVMCAMDLFQAGSETTSSHIMFAFLFMIVRPDIQRKIQQEIETVIGNDRLPQLSDRIKLSYTQATILEVFRWARVTVNLVPRKVTQRVRYKKWDIEQDTVILVNVHSIHFDEDFWGDPNTFRPERFLDSNGTIIPDKAERIIPFGSGKRVCPGESVARDSFFLYLTTLLQIFTFEIAPGDNPPTTEPVVGFALSPVPFRALVKQRNCAN